MRARPTLPPCRREPGDTATENRCARTVPGGLPGASWKGTSAEVGQTGRMRIYLPATAAHLRASVLGSSHQPLTAHAATPALAQALPEEDEEGLEVSASLCAADASVVLLAEPEAAGLADRRIVIAADVDAENVREVPVEGDVLPGTIEVTGEIPWEDVAALLVDEPEAQNDVRAARLGDEDAFERAADADLLWYDVTEREALAESLGV